MADVRVEIDEAAIAEMLSDWSSPIGQYIAELTERAEGVAKVLAPVSPRGSLFAPAGYLAGRIKVSHQHSDTGTVMGMVGIPLRAGSRYPLPFVSNPSGITWNRGHRSARPAANHFLLAALNAVAGGS